MALYLPSFRHGLIWDDPIWYAQSTGTSVWAALSTADTYQFYRPLAILLNRALVRPDGVVRCELAHLIQTAAHTGATLCVAMTLCCLGCSRKAALLGAFFFCLHPLAYQAVAWQAPQQPIATLLVLVAYLLAERYVALGKMRCLGASLGVLALALLFQESALPFTLLAMWPLGRSWLRTKRTTSFLCASIYLVLAAGYLWIWLHVPRKGGITGGGLDLRVLAYMLQGVVFPMASAIAHLPLERSPIAACSLYGSAAIVLAVALPESSARRRGLASLALVAMGIAPVWGGLSWPYVQVGSRLCYPALLGSGMLWGPWLAWAIDPKRRLMRVVVGAAMALAVTVVALAQWRSFNRLQALGASHIARTVAVQSEYDGGRILFVNYPDRMRLRSEPYALGYWGLTLAPVSQDLAGFGRSIAGLDVETRSRAHFQNGAKHRDGWTYLVDMRGEDTSAEEIVKHVDWADAVYLTTYGAPGELGLDYVGGMVLETLEPSWATLGEVVELVSFQIGQPTCESQRITVEMTLRAGPERHVGDTLFVHLLTPDRQHQLGCDGDALAGMLPLAVWASDKLVVDVRYLDVSALPAGEYVLTMGCYNWETRTRYPAFDITGTRYWDDEVVMATIVIDE